MDFCKCFGGGGAGVGCSDSIDGCQHVGLFGCDIDC